MSKPTADELLESFPIDRFGNDQTRWGYRETQVYRLDDGTHWAVNVLVTTGDEGGWEAESEPWQVEQVEVVTKHWKPVGEKKPDAVKETP